jgi:hypothetical protein
VVPAVAPVVAPAVAPAVEPVKTKLQTRMPTPYRVRPRITKKRKYTVSNKPRNKPENKPENKSRNTVKKTKRISGHVSAGKKAEISIKGKAWLDEVHQAKQKLDTILKSYGKTQKSQQMDARRFASLLRKNPQNTRRFIKKMISNYNK